MNWPTLLLPVALLAAWFLFKRMSFVSASRARQLLRQGALVLDVRQPGEFRSGHLPTALNIPLSELCESLPRQVPDKNQALLLHCFSGTRSGIGKRHLANLGYRNVFNLGSYGRARRIVQGAAGKNHD